MRAVEIIGTEDCHDKHFLYKCVGVCELLTMIGSDIKAKL